MAEPYRILMSNIGYAKGIGGSLWEHVSRAGRHLYCSLPLQQRVLNDLKNLIDGENPDLCCLIEIDRGSFHSAYLNQLSSLIDENYHFYDIADKYGENNPIGKLPMHRGKSNGFIARDLLAFERRYFTHGSKRLIYHITLPDGTALFFAHFSLKKKVREKQFQEMRKLVTETTGSVIILGDFNIFSGFDELKPLLDGTGMILLNNRETPTFQFATYEAALDLCICSENIAENVELKIVPQPFSDHSAVMLTLNA